MAFLCGAQHEAREILNSHRDLVEIRLGVEDPGPDDDVSVLSSGNEVVLVVLGGGHPRHGRRRPTRQRQAAVAAA